ncbi:MAG: D-lysine 5,6-aminomutase subunit alpha [Clostridiales bacterium]|nr:D-lysine 5,6-aminomutase subunit alpha [Clostridiales bacterium]
MNTQNKLRLDAGSIARCRDDALRIASQVQEMIDLHTTVSVERAVLRLVGVDGVDAFEVPLPNLMVEQVRQGGDLSRGVSAYLAGALLATGLDVQGFCAAFLEDKVSLLGHTLPDSRLTADTLRPYLEASFQTISHHRQYREAQLARFGARQPEIYVIVATGNIYEDVKQAQSAVRAGADVIAVIRTTGQSLLDYVPYGATTEGFGGTMATQENFRIMRQALDALCEAEGRYIKLVNYASGLCMPEIAVMGALERLDMMLNDSMYGIIFRDINMQRTFVDQYFSRSLNALAGITINTGEDNYLTTADAVGSAHTVLASQFINERFAQLAGLPKSQMGLGHAFEIDPDLEDSFLLELAQAQMAREIFPEAPLKYMPPTTHSTGNIFQTQAVDTLFNAATMMTGQGIHLLAMMTEAIHTPFLSDRHLAIRNARMVQSAMRHLQEEISFKEDGRIMRRAQQVLREAERLLRDIADTGLFEALEQGVFADVRRDRNQGKGLEGVIKKHPDYCNPAMDLLREALA